MPRIKPSFDGYSQTEIPGSGGGFYDGPPPPPDTYRGVVKRLALNKIKSGPNEGADRIALVLEIAEGPYQGAGIITSFNLTQQGAPFLNQFLYALTDGTQEQKDGIRQAFWRVGYDVANEADTKLGRPITKIGSKTNPIGMSCHFVTKMGANLDGEPRAEIARFVVSLPPSERTGGNGSESTTTKDTPLEGLSEFASDVSDPWA